jgi:hypothetical protein
VYPGEKSRQSICGHFLWGRWCLPFLRHQRVGGAGFAVVEQEEILAKLPCLVLFSCRCVFDHQLDGRVDIFGPVFFVFILILFSLVFCLANFVGFFAYLVIPICSLEELAEDAFVHLDSLGEMGILLEGGENALGMALWSTP